MCKKRIALPGKGKSGSTRTLVAKQHKTALFFIAGRLKSDRGPDFTGVEEEATKLYSGMLQAVNTQRLKQMATDGALTEICNGKEDDEE